MQERTRAGPSTQRAALLIDAGRLDDGIAEAQAAVAADPEAAGPHAMLALGLSRKGRHREAKAAAQKAIAKEPASPSAHGTLGRVLLADKDWIGAQHAFRRALALDPEDANLHNDLGLAYLGHHRYKEARPQFEKVIALAPEAEVGHHNLSIVLDRLGDTEGSRAALARALAIKPDDSKALWLQGHAHLRKGEEREAARAFRESLRLDPTFKTARRDLVSVAAKWHPIVGPFAAWSLLMARIPPRWRLLAAFLIPTLAYRALRAGAQAAGFSDAWVLTISVVFFVWIAYTWLAGPLVDLFLRKGWLDV